MKNYTIVAIGKEAKDKLKKGIDTVADIIGATLGPAGRNCVLEYGDKTPRIVNDGMSIAQSILLEDEIENQGAQVLIDVAMKTSAMVGDGTTTSVILARAIINEAKKRLPDKVLGVNSANAMEVKREIEKACQEAVEQIKKASVSIKDKTDIEKVATIAMESEPIGKIIAETVNKVGKDGYIMVESGFKDKPEYEVINGMKFIGSYISDLLITDKSKREAVFNDVAVLSTNLDITSAPELDKMVKIIAGDLKKYNFVIISPNFEGTIITPSIIETTLKAPMMKVPFRILGIKVPTLDNEQIEDIAVATGGVFISKESGKELSEVEAADFGLARKVITNEDDTIIIGGGGTKEEIAERVKTLKENIKIEKTDHFQKVISQRIASLSSGVGLIKVGSKTDVERNYIRLKVQNAVNSARAAMEEGVVQGGGLTLKKIAETLPKSILTEPLKTPFKQIQENAGGNLEIGKDIIDPAKVQRVALENACSMAGLLITTESVVCFEKKPFEQEITRLMMERRIE